MHVQSVRVYRYSLPLREPLVLKGIAHVHREGLLVNTTTDTGTSGWGEIAPLPGFSRESLHEVEEQIRAYKSKLLGEDVSGLFDRVGHSTAAGNALAPSVRFGVELALSEITRGAGQTLQPPGTARDFVPVNALLTSGTRAAVRELIAAGYHTIKLKVGRAPVQEDVRMVRDVIEAMGEGIRLRLDANRSWSFKDAVAFAEGVGDLPCEYIEEPLADASRLRLFVEQTGARVALDESLTGIAPGEMMSHRYATAVVLKPTLLGGLSGTAEYARQALASGMKPVISAAFESGVSIRAMALLALELGLTDTAMGLGTYRWFAEDVLAPSLRLERGGFEISDLVNERRHVRLKLLREVR